MNQADRSVPEAADQPKGRRLTGPVRPVLLEALLVAVAGVALALMANQLSPRGLALGRNYFPTDGLDSGAGASATNLQHASPLERAAARIVQRGLQLVDTPQALELFRDPRREAGLIVFVDARDDAHYQAGHVPGAFQFDHYRPERYLPEVVPVCLTAELVVVYCTGADCEDSEFAAVALSQAGVPKQRLFVYLGGFAEWTTNRLPVELGPRNSGQIRTWSP